MDKALMRVGVVNNQVPFLTGGAERQADNLCRALAEYGHAPELITMPFKWYPGETLARHILAARMLDLGEAAGTPMDLMIGLRFPAWLAQHPNKVHWIIHQHRQAYDMWDSGESDLLNAPDGAALRAMIHDEDRAALGAPDARVFAGSGNVADRLERYLGIKAPPLFHPPGLAGRLQPGEYGDYLFMPSRIGPMKRQLLAVEALSRTRSPIRLRIAGVADAPEHQAALERRIHALGVGDRVELLGRVTDEEMARLYGEARAVVFIPVDEDYGYIALEAMLSARAVITATDSGGPLEFIENGVEGLVVEADALALAHAFDTLHDDRAAAIRMGEAGAAHYAARDINWENVVRTLTGASDAERPAVANRPVDIESHPAPPPIPVAETVAPVDAAALLRQAVAVPPADPPLAFDSVASLYEVYDFERHVSLADADPYFGTHWTRYCATIDTIRRAGVEAGSRPRVLDIGLFPPFVFQALLLNEFPGAELSGVWEGPEIYRGQARSRDERFPSFAIELLPVNVECEALPFAADTFDLVLGLEILEHLAINPLFFFQEIWRVLRPEGRVVITTPNVVSHRGAGKALAGIAPYSFGIYVPTSGFYGRHNREYAPRDVAHLARVAGFDQIELRTADAYVDDVDPSTAELLHARGDDFSKRGEVIMYSGKKAPARDTEMMPLLFHGDPEQLAGIISAEPRDPATGNVRLTLTNTSRKTWYVDGDGAVTLFTRWRSADGKLCGDADYAPKRLRLPHPVAPGAVTEIDLQLDSGDLPEPCGEIELDLFQEGAGVFSPAGRANRLLLPCSETAWRRFAQVRG